MELDSIKLTYFLYFFTEHLHFFFSAKHKEVLEVTLF